MPTSINNPLTVIHNLARLMERQPENPANQEDIKSILHQSIRAIQTVEQLLDYGRPIQPRRERLLIASLCNEIALRWQKHSNIAVELKVVEDLLVWIDLMQFEELLENLLDNAREAAPEGVVVLQVACRDRRARVSVLDQGPGFSSDALT
ncbi:MAG: HAMP domain-containing histidine kinase, partial [Gammaproteobacteria bacterium]|nr:HAMP domain-containing histidine kinase [Gammaproteobacteria bacterium]